jgi:CDP-diacylglycerol--serine O-phosphatidyltransferase
MPLSRLLRYLAPNFVTALGMLFGFASLLATHEHRFVDAGWLIIWAVLLDRVDGFVARLFKATSAFGVQMDSFADAVNFGIAPAFLVAVSLGSSPALGFAEGTGAMLLLGACVLWALANVVRLAKFNVVADDPGSGPKVFWGVPTTLAAGLLVIWYLVLLEYAPAGAPLGGADAFTSPHILGSWHTPVQAWSYVPAAMIVGAIAMVSSLPIPKLAPMRSRSLTIAVLVTVLVGYVCGFLRTLPDFMALMPTTWLVACLIWSQLSSQARGLRPPAVFPDPGPLRRNRE